MLSPVGTKHLSRNRQRSQLVLEILRSPEGLAQNDSIRRKLLKIIHYARTGDYFPNTRLISDICSASCSPMR